MLLLVVILLVGSALFLLTLALMPPVLEKAKSWQDKRQKVVEKELDKLFYDKSPQKIMRLYYIVPPAFGLAAALLFKSVLLTAVGVVAGFFVPNLVLKMRDTKRRQQFNGQLLDAIMILSSSLKGGLSLLQALEVLEEEMPAPMQQEIGLVVRENKMGVSLEESLRHLGKRMNMDELSMVINSILVARETGGDLTKVFSRLTTTIRDNRKLKDSIRTLTLQGRMQGVIMSALPFVFVWWVIAFNRNHFNIMLESETGRMLLIVAIILQVVGMVLIRKFSEIKI
ncbi:MAG: type II secretion system F family protein [Candidatus Omnitrophica bacterium]|nr:type II secretion system F family protein [Candidatus Omnitrophota bacterium]